jgi:hypothetical protein
MNFENLCNDNLPNAKRKNGYSTFAATTNNASDNNIGLIAWLMF